MTLLEKARKRLGIGKEPEKEKPLVGDLIWNLSEETAILVESGTVNVISEYPSIKDIVLHPSGEDYKLDYIRGEISFKMLITSRGIDENLQVENVQGSKLYVATTSLDITEVKQ